MQFSNYSISLPHGETDTFEWRTAKAQFIYLWIAVKLGVELAVDSLGAG